MMQRHAISVKECPGVCGVKQSVSMPDHSDAYVVQEYVDAEMESGCAFSWAFECTIRPDVLSIESDFRIIHASGEGQDVLETIADETISNMADWASTMVRIVERLCLVRPPS